ncbi:unnamed protein product [Allacma fusca]|uniref:Uncharacterized protein n=1 Tax=Allacma fusca TaxID=39272 RepID=A0A8J2JPB2_9HEXA|nr:unnamed protein product [Allacma fusca]
MDSHHDRETLEICQRVCPEWAAVASKRLEDLESDESFKLSTKFADMKIVEEHLKFVPKHCHNFNIKLPPKGIPAMENVFKKVGRQVKELDVCFKIKDKHYPNPPIDHFGDYLELYCPKLEKLKLWLSSSEHYPESIFSQDMPHFLPVKHIETEDFSDNAQTHIFEELIEASPFLESLTFQHESTELIVRMLSIIADRYRLQQLASIESYHFDVSDAFIAFALQHHWNLENLKIAFRKDVSIGRIRALLNHLSDTLVSLEIIYKGAAYDPCLSIEDNWVIPVGMKKLKHLTVTPNVFSNACRFLVNGLQLFGLRSFKITSAVSWSENYFEAMWRRNRIKLHDRRLETVEIPCSCLDASIFLQEPNPFKNIKELVLDSPSIKVLQAVFAEQENLERLKVFELYSLNCYSWDDILSGYCRELRGRPLMWDEILTGRQKPGYTMMYKMMADPLLEGIPTIRNLKKLKYLLLDFKSSHQKVSDFFIYHGLMYLTELQHLDINRHDFTEEAVQDLRGRLVNFCYLELGTDSESDDEVDYRRKVTSRRLLPSQRRERATNVSIWSYLVGRKIFVGAWWRS